MTLVPDFQPTQGSYLIDQLRSIKSPDEQNKMRVASSKNDQAMEELLTLIPLGLS